MSPEAMHLSLSKALMVSVFQRFFLVAFWYVVGGIGLAVLARGLVALAEQWPQAPARPRVCKNVRPCRLDSCQAFVVNVRNCRRSGRLAA